MLRKYIYWALRLITTIFGKIQVSDFNGKSSSWNIYFRDCYYLIGNTNMDFYEKFRPKCIDALKSRDKDNEKLVRCIYYNRCDEVSENGIKRIELPLTQICLYLLLR